MHKSPEMLKKSRYGNHLFSLHKMQRWWITPLNTPEGEELEKKKNTFLTKNAFVWLNWLQKGRIFVIWFHKMCPKKVSNLTSIDKRCWLATVVRKKKLLPARVFKYRVWFGRWLRGVKPELGSSWLFFSTYGHLAWSQKYVVFLLMVNPVIADMSDHF